MTEPVSRRGRGLLAALASISLLAVPAAAQDRASVGATAEAAPGTPQRRAILDALRPAIEARLGPRVEFVVSEIRVRQGWALVVAEPQRRGGARIDGGRYFPDDWDHMDGLTTSAILRFSGGRWTLVDHAIGATDVWYCGGILPAAVAPGFGC